MPEWGFWSLFFIVSLASLAAARRLDRGFGAGSSSSGSVTRQPARSSSTSSSVPHSTPATPRPEPLSVQVPLD